MVAKSGLIRGAIAALLWTVIGAGVAHAHGGMAGPDELGPPVGISVGIGLACYYLITLWPARSRAGHNRSSGKTDRRTAK